MPDPSLLQALDAERSAFLDALERVPPQDRGRPPAPDAWSALGIAEHLLLIEQSMAGLLDKWLARGRLPALDAPEPAHLAALERALDGRRQYRVPEGAGPVHPTGAPDYAALHEAWVAVGGRWHALADALPAEWHTQPLIRHPLAGPLAWDGVLRFLTAHLRHHRAQLERTVAAL